MPPSLIHLLTEGGQLTTTGVVCGARDAAVASWDRARVTCPACLRQCTCAPGVAVCPACRTWAQTHRADGSRKPRPALPAIRSEKQFQEVIRQAALEAHWLYYHPWTSVHSADGFPDVTMVRGTHLRFAELKMPDKTPTPAQQQWLDALGQVTQVSTHLWTPDDWGEIATVLQ